MRVFVAVAEGEGFAPAARRLSLSPPAVTRAVAALEQRIGTRLLHRTTRQVRLTEAGTRFLADCKRILSEVEDAEASAAGAHGEPRGTLSITAPVMFGRMHVVPVVLAFRQRHPGIHVRLMLFDRVTDMMDEGFDVAIRIAHLPDSALSAVRVGAVNRVVCAAPSYLAARGAPRRPEDLLDHAVIASYAAAAGGAPEWSFEAGGRIIAVRPQPSLQVNAADPAIAAAVAGHGLTRVLSYQIVPELRAGRLAVVLAEFQPPPLPIHVVHLEGRRAAARVRAFVDFAVERLRTHAVLD